MDQLIKLLPDNIANQIAAGEVIQRPASVVKELVENAIDAGATEVTINIKDAGKTLIQVIDNGKGMDPLDARMAFERHATSKIRTADDLFTLTTMGFRGEALPSIAAVAHVTLQTRTESSEQGTKLQLEGSQVKSCEPVSCAVGSNFSIRHLFYNVPARRKFLKQDETEFRHITSEVQNIAAVHPSLSFTLRHNDTPIIEVYPAPLKQRIIDLFGKRYTHSLLPLNVDTPIATIKGFIGTVDSTRKRGAQQYLFTNERYMKHATFSRVVLNSYGNMIPKGEYPDYFLYLTVDPAEIDVNISPTKTEIKFAQEQNISTILYSAVREALMLGASLPTLDFSEQPESEKIDIPILKSQESKEAMDEPPVVGSFTKLESKMNRAEKMAAPPLPEEHFKMPDLSDWDSFYQEFEAKRHQATSTKKQMQKALLLPSQEHHKEPIKPTLPLPWLYDAYALFPTAQGIMQVHIERARMRVAYHHYKRQYQRGGVISNRLLFPVLIDLAPREDSLLREHIELLTTLGFDISDMGQSAYSINALPEGIQAGAEEELLTELLEMCQHSGRSSEETIVDSLVTSLTQFRLRQSHEPLTPEEVGAMVEELLQVPEYQIAPDGKKTIAYITTDFLHKNIT